MKLRALIFLLLIMLMLLSACADVDVSYKLSDDNTVNIDYMLTLAPSGKDVTSYINLIKKYWKDMGLSTESSEENGAYTVKGNKTASSGSRSEAAAGFSSAFTDKNSLFYDVNFMYTPSYFEDNYELTASISLKDIIRKNKDDRIPETEVNTFLKSAESGKYKLSISLPGEVQKTNADERDGQTCIWILKYGQTRKIEITSKKVFEENVAYYTKLSETDARDNLLFLICCITAGIVLVIIIIIIISRSIKRTKTSEIVVKRF